MISLILAIIAFGLGYFYRDIRDKLDYVMNKLEVTEPEVGATNASYGRVDSYKVNQAGDVGLVEPKTAQRLEWEEAERLRKMQL